MCLPHVFLSFPFIKRKVLRAALDALGLGRIGSVSSKSLPPMSCGDKWVWGQVLSKACCVLESAVSGNAESISLCSGIFREVLTKTPMDFSMNSSRLLFFLQSPAMQWMHSHTQMLEVMHVRCELRFWARESWSQLQSEFCIVTMKPIYFSPSQAQLHFHTWYLLLLSTQFAMCRRLPHYLLWVYLELPEGMGAAVSPGRSSLAIMPNESVWCTK